MTGPLTGKWSLTQVSTRPWQDQGHRIMVALLYSKLPRATGAPRLERPFVVCATTQVTLPKPLPFARRPGLRARHYSRRIEGLRRMDQARRRAGVSALTLEPSRAAAAETLGR
jgi:hypothetical protein